MSFLTEELREWAHNPITLKFQEGIGEYLSDIRNQLSQGFIREPEGIQRAIGRCIAAKSFIDSIDEMKRMEEPKEEVKDEK